MPIHCTIEYVQQYTVYPTAIIVKDVLMLKNIFYVATTTLLGIAYSLDSRHVSVDRVIAQACGNYLKQKGLPPAQFMTVANPAQWAELYEAGYAATYGDYKILMSPNMVQSIARALQTHRSMPIYPAYALLHEMGHHYPYGRACHDLELQSHRLLGAGIVLTCISVALAQDVKHLRSVSYVTGALSLALVVAAAYLHDYRVVPLKRRFAKYALPFNSPEYKKHEERDADLFAMQLLTTAELAELRPAIKSEMGAAWLNDGIHQSPDEKCAMALAELARRKEYIV